MAWTEGSGWGTFSELQRFAGSAKLNKTPLVAMVSYAIVHRLGVERFLNDAATAGLDGMIVPDLPVEESEAMMNRATLHSYEIDPVDHSHDPTQAHPWRSPA